MVRKSKGSIVVEVSRQKNPGRVGYTISLHMKRLFDSLQMTHVISSCRHNGHNCGITLH